MEPTVYLTLQGALAALCWLIVSFGAGIAVFCQRHRDGLFERISLSCISLFSLAAAWRITHAGWVNDGSLYLALSLAGYCLSVAYKYVKLNHTFQGQT